MNLPDRILKRYGTAPRLFEMVCLEVTDEILSDISVADYGDSADLHLSELKRLRNGEQWDLPLKWHPGEVMQLCRWAKIENETSTIKRSTHIERVFCAEGLRRIGDHSENLKPYDISLLEPLIVSCLALGSTWTLALIGEMVRQVQDFELIFSELPDSNAGGLEQLYWIYALYVIVVVAETDIEGIDLHALGDFLVERAFVTTPTENPTFLQVARFGLHNRPLLKTLCVLALDTSRSSGTAEKLMSAVKDSEKRSWRNRSGDFRGEAYLRLKSVLPIAIQQAINARDRNQEED